MKSFQISQHQLIMEQLRQQSIQYINEVIGCMKNTKVIEESIYAHFLKNASAPDEYRFKAKSIIHNLKTIKANIDNDSLGYKLEDVASQTMLTLNQERWNKQIRRSELNHERTNAKPQETTDQFRCSKCNQNKTCYYLRQTRSIDEPETAFITCVNCKNQWRQNG
jgi:DNA-directed RNA polymerase subunit M/transcription elongation factor TFIIS